MDEPGIGGERWIEAWQDCIKDLSGWQQTDGLDDAAIKKELGKAQKEWKFWLEPQRFRRSEGIPVQLVQDVCHRIAQWSGGIAQRNNDYLFLTASGHSSALSEVDRSARRVSYLCDPTWPHHRRDNRRRRVGTGSNRGGCSLVSC